MSVDIVLIEPEIPQNTGNIARTCAAIGATLHLVKPLGFKLEDRYLKRAGLDYWNLLNVIIYENIDEFFNNNSDRNLIFATTKGGSNYAKFKYDDGCMLVFGKETAGLPEELLMENPQKCARIPMIEDARSLNLSNAVAIMAYEALRQQNFPNMKHTGKFKI